MHKFPPLIACIKGPGLCGYGKTLLIGLPSTNGGRGCTRCARSLSVFKSILHNFPQSSMGDRVRHELAGARRFATARTLPFPTHPWGRYGWRSLCGAVLQLLHSLAGGSHIMYLCAAAHPSYWGQAKGREFAITEKTKGLGLQSSLTEEVLIQVNKGCKIRTYIPSC